MNRFKQFLKFWFIPCTENHYKPHVLSSKPCLVIAIVLICIKLVSMGFFSRFPKTLYFAAVTADRLVELANQSRQTANLPSLKTNNQLNEAAYLKALDILENDYFSHTSPMGTTPWYWFKQADYNYHYAGENLAIDFLDSETLHQAWFDSPTHRDNILNSNYNEMGIAVLTGEFKGHQTTVAVQLFGSQFEKPIQTAQKPAASKTPTNSPTSVRQNEKEPILTQQEEKIEQQLANITQEKLDEFKNLAVNIANIKNKTSTKILGAIAQKSDRAIQKVFVCALIFMIVALMLNVFIKINVQHPRLIINCILVLVLIAILILVNEKYLLNGGLQII